MRFLKIAASLAARGGAALSALWTFPALLLSAFLVAWGAEAAQFLISQGLALALLAWLQTLPEFAVEAVIAWEAGADPARAHLAIANLTGAIRLLLGFGWPMIYFVHAWARRKREGGTGLAPIRLAAAHAVEVTGLLPPVLYFGYVVLKGSFSWLDAMILIACYLAYLLVLLRHEPRETEDLADAPRVAQWAYRQPGWRRPAAIGGLFAGGGALLFVTTHPFLESMLAIAGIVGISQFFVVQWVAPFLSEFPEMVSTFTWARRVHRAPTALMNLVSSNINQWTVLAAMIPLVFGWSHLRHHGVWSDFHFDPAQQLELVLTLAQTGLGIALLADLTFGWREAAALLALWLVQFVLPESREWVAAGYGVWLAGTIGSWIARGRMPAAVKEFGKSWR